jgi:hypothetical protein
LEPLHKLWETWRDQVEFVVVYIREAHPEEGWVVSPNRDQGILINDPETIEDRTEVAETCALRLKIRMPVVVDDVDDRIASAYGALPDRLYLIDKGGRIAYQGERGPWGFKPEELAQAIEALQLPG